MHPCQIQQFYLTYCHLNAQPHDHVLNYLKYLLQFRFHPTESKQDINTHQNPNLKNTLFFTHSTPFPHFIRLSLNTTTKISVPRTMYSFSCLVLRYRYQKKPFSWIHQFCQDRNSRKYCFIILLTFHPPKGKRPIAGIASKWSVKSHHRLYGSLRIIPECSGFYYNVL